VGALASYRYPVLRRQLLHTHGLGIGHAVKGGCALVSPCLLQNLLPHMPQWWRLRPLSHANFARHTTQWPCDSEDTGAWPEAALRCASCVFTPRVPSLMSMVSMGGGVPGSTPLVLMPEPPPRIGTTCQRSSSSSSSKSTRTTQPNPLQPTAAAPLAPAAYLWTFAQACRWCGTAGDRALGCWGTRP